jgi:hypothetical protein
MALRRIRRIAVFTGAFLVLLIGVGTYELWILTALRVHPWQLESHVDSLAANCRTGPGAFVFAEELRTLAVQIADAKHCLTHADVAWTPGRDYDPCVEKLLTAALIAMRIRTSQEARVQDEKARLGVELKTLELDLATDPQAPKSGARIEVKNYEQSRARTLLETAHNLAALGQTGSALTAALSARAAWSQSENLVAAELARFYDGRLREKWEKEAQDLLRWTRQSGRSAILVDNLEHRCLLLADGQVAKSYVANLSRNWYRRKAQEHDASTPEGEYKVRQKAPATSFGAALLLDYPNAADWQRFNSMKKTKGIEAGARIGGAIEIHCSGRLNSDWTDGCVALEDADMEDLFKRAYVGMPVTIVGTCTVGGNRKQ